MKKPTLISALAAVAITTASLALPATASASSFKPVEVQKVHGGYQRDQHDRRGHDVDRYYIERHRDYRHPGYSRWAPSRYQHGYGRQHDRRYDYRPVERHRHHHDDDVRLRIFYDLHL